MIEMSVLFKMFTDLIKYKKIVHLNIDLWLEIQYKKTSIE